MNMNNSKLQTPNPKLTPGQIKCIQVMLTKLRLSSQRMSLIHGFSSGRTESLRELHVGEATDMIRYLKSQDPEEKAAEVMRRKIIAMAHEMKWELPGRKIDMRKLDGWMVNSSYLHKKLNQYLYSELPLLVTQFEKVYQSFLNGI